MKYKKLLFLFLALMGIQTGRAGEFVWYDGTSPVSYHLSTEVAPVVSIALDMLNGDLKQVTGKCIQSVSQQQAAICIVQLDKAKKDVKDKLQQAGIPMDELANKQDGFCLKVVDNQLFVVGSDRRGTAYGILELSRLAGVSPWVWWSDVTPEKKNCLALPEDFYTFQSPSVEYRGIFLNDEDWSLQPWSWMTFEPSPVKGRIGAKTYKEIFKLLLRLRANAIWSGMHGITTPFYWIPGAKEVADSCGIVIGTSHCEPLMCNSNGEWKKVGKGDYNYVDNRENVRTYWTNRLKETQGTDCIFTIGMRGVHDGPMQGVGKDLDDKTRWLQRVIDDQRNLLEEHVGKDAEMIPQQFVPYKEVLDIMENGLNVPDDVMLTWCDDNYGYMTRLSDEAQQKRSGGAGVYYHLSYWGRPHDYMWLCTTQPGLVYNEMKQAYDHNARRLWIVNVHDLKPAAYDLELFLDMAWDINCVTPSTLNEHLKQWLCREFGKEAGEKLLPAMQEYYRLCAIRKPEFMGWTQVELDKNRYPRGRSQVIDTEFSLTEFGGELDRYLSDFRAIKETILKTEAYITPDRKDAYYSHIKYQVLAAEAMARKMLEAQRARSYAMGQCDETLWGRDEAMLRACAESQKAYQEIRQLTDFYNNRMAGGKWKYSMCYNPRDLYVFFPPILPVWQTDAEVDSIRKVSDVMHPLKGETEKDSWYLAKDACDYNRATEGAYTVQMLGHSMNAVVLPKGGSLTYEFDSPQEGEAVLRTAVIPTQPNDKGDIRFSVSLDGEKPIVISFREKGRTETWKKNVLRGQAVKNTKHTLTKGQHTLTITALDNHVVVDQWMLDFNTNRRFYVFPTETNK